MHFKPHIAFWSLIPFALAYGQWNKYGPFDNGTHDTPMIIHQMTFALIVSILFSIVGYIYLTSKKNAQNRWTGINLTHWVMTTFGLAGFWLYSYVKVKMNFGQEFYDLVGYGRFDKINTGLLVVLVASQIMIFLNRNPQANI